MVIAQKKKAPGIPEYPRQILERESARLVTEVVDTLQRNSARCLQVSTISHKDDTTIENLFIRQVITHQGNTPLTLFFTTIGKGVH